MAHPLSAVAYKVLVERLVNHRMNLVMVGVAPYQQSTIEMPAVDDQLMYDDEEDVLRKKRLDFFYELAKSPENAREALQRTFRTRKGNNHDGLTANQANAAGDMFTKVSQVMDALVKADLDDTLEAVYDGVRAMIEKLELHVAREGFKAGWNQAKNQAADTVDQPRDDAAAAYDPHAGGLGHNSY